MESRPLTFKIEAIKDEIRQRLGVLQDFETVAAL